MKIPSRKFPWITVKGVTENLLLKVGFVRNFALKKARDKVMELTNGVYPAPLKILDVRLVCCLVQRNQLLPLYPPSSGRT